VISLERLSGDKKLTYFFDDKTSFVTLTSRPERKNPDILESPEAGKPDRNSTAQLPVQNTAGKPDASKRPETETAPDLRRPKWSFLNPPTKSNKSSLIP